MNRSWRWELIIPLLAVSALMLVCINSAFYLPFWFDELLTHYVAGDSSFTHMLGADADLINSTPPLYFIIAWPVTQVFGAGELPLRLLSSLGISAALMTTWHLLRRLYGNWPASLAVTVGFLGSTAVWYQDMEARVYGLFLAEIALAVALAVRAISNRPVRWYHLLGNAVVHAALVTTHYFGFFYSGAILLATLTTLLKRRQTLIRFAGSVMLGWTAFVPCIPIFLHHLEFTKPHGWLQPPTVSEFFKFIGGDLLFTLPAAVAILGCAWLLRPRGNRRSDGKMSFFEIDAERRGLGFIMLALFCIPCAVWVKSRIGTPLFLPKYCFGTVLVWTFLYADLTQYVFDRSRAAQHDTAAGNRTRLIARLPSVMCTLIVGCYLLIPALIVANRVWQGQYPKFATTVTLTSMPLGPSGQPVVFENVGEFLPVNYYAPAPGRYFVIADRAAAIDPRACRDANNLDQIAAALKRQYPDLPILTTDELVHQLSDFVVVDGDGFRWFERNLKDQPGYRSELLPNETEELRRRRYKRVLIHNLEPPEISVAPRQWRRQ